MLSLLAHRLLSLFQLTRLALVFTAIADAWCGLLLLGRQRVGPEGSVLGELGPWPFLLVAGVSSGLYAFGMSLNDLIDRRRDAAIAPARPLPSGRISPTAAQGVAAMLLAMAFGCAAVYSSDAASGWMSLVLTVFTAMLIIFYDLAGKYLVAPGLIALGLIRFFNAIVAAPELPVLWHPMLLLNHVAIVSMVAYRWEEKRPALSRRQAWLVVGGLLLLNVMIVLLVVLRRSDLGPLGRVLQLQPGLVYPLIALLGFLTTAIIIRRRAPSSRVAGQRLMLAGLLWLIVYDATFVAGYVSLAWAGVIAALLPVAYLSVLLMRWWSTIVALSHRPAFKRAE